MAFDLKSISRNEATLAPRVMLYGVEGIGKSTFAAYSPKPIFILTEDGLGSLPVQHFPLAKTVASVMSAITTLYDEKHDYKTVVLDSLDWLEAMVWQEMEAKHDAKDLAYGKGASIAADKWRTIVTAFDALRTKHGMNVILIAHSMIKRFDSPETEPYDRYQPKLQERSGSLIREWADAVLFANWKTIVKQSDVGFNKTVSRGVSSGERMLFTSERPAYMAKNRYSLPESIPLDWDAFAEAIKPKKE